MDTYFWLLPPKVIGLASHTVFTCCVAGKHACDISAAVCVGVYVYIYVRMYVSNIHEVGCREGGKGGHKHNTSSMLFKGMR